MFFHRASMLNKIPKIHVKIFKNVVARASGLNITTPSWAWCWPWGLNNNLPVTVFHRADMFNKIPKIYVKSFKTVDARASELRFPTPSSAWGWPWGWYQTILTMSSILNKIPKIYVKSFETLDAGASGLHFITPSWAWRWPRGWYQKLSVMFFQRAIKLNKTPKIHVKSFKTVDARASGLNYTPPSWA